MSRPIKVIETAACCLLGLLMVGMAAILFIPGKSHLLIVNKANEDIATLKLKVWKREYELGPLKKGGSKSLDFPVVGDSHYTARVEFCSGRVLYFDDGYVSSALFTNDEMLVKADSIAFNRLSTEANRRLR